MRINTGAWKDQSGADESQVALTKKKKKKSRSSLPGKEPCENRGQIPTYEPEGNYVSRKYGLGEGKTTKIPL